MTLRGPGARDARRAGARHLSASFAAAAARLSALAPEKRAASLPSTKEMKVGTDEIVACAGARGRGRGGAWGRD